MGAKAAGSVFWAVFLVLLPVAVKLSSPTCVSYRIRNTCGLKGSSVEFPCSFPNDTQVISISGWNKRLHPNRKLVPLKQTRAYLFRKNFLERGNNDCTLKLTDIKKTDTSSFHFVYHFRNVKGATVTCGGAPGVRLEVFESPVKLLVDKFVRRKDHTVIESQKVVLTCVPTCATNLNSNPGYIWYKNTLQLNGSRANSPSLSLDPISIEDTGSYVCAMIGYKDLPSSPVNLTVQRRPVNMLLPAIHDDGSKKDCVQTQNSTDQIFNNYLTPKSKSMFTFSVTCIVSVCMGWVIVIIVVILVRAKKKKNEKNRRCSGSVPGPPDPNSDSYMALDIESMSAEYGTLSTVRRCSAADPVYENLQHNPLR
ncbi:uncharacterized protein LOC115024726 [Cottoperca gobio]|uniref:Uncharacterized protein LOC115024726 n=1 Tax=Cottoperca gobio TaxID=56716 RepID=A0A6J2RQ74_COTGO|nr:uncharacterized protein LOC115024726 [Cottoperca gobio]